jgi:hypothetical protein
MMNNSKLLYHSFLFSVGVIVYIVLVASIMQNAEELFGKMQNIWGPIAFLMLFVVSAAICGLLVFGRPVYLFLNGQKRESVKLALYTIGFLFIETVIVLAALALAR